MVITRFFVSLYFIILSGGLFAQSVDSLHALLSSASEKKERISILKQLGDTYLAKRDTSAIQYFEELIALSQSPDDPLLRANTYYRMGVCYFQKPDLKRSSDLYFKGLEFATESSEFDEIKAKLYNAIGWNFNLMGEDAIAIKNYNQAELISKAVDNLQLKALILNNKGVSYRHLNQYNRALLSFQNSLVLNRKINNQRQIRFNLNNISTVLYDLKRFNEALNYLNEALPLNREAEDTVEIINNLINLGLVNLEDGSRKEAGKQLNEALGLSVKLKARDQRLRIYHSLASLAQRDKNYFDAFTYLNEFTKLRDSLYRKESVEKIAELEAKYGSLKKERDLQEAQKNVIEQRLYIGLTLGALTTTLIIIFFLWRLIKVKRASEKRLLELNHDIQIQAEELKQANEEINVTNENLEQLVKNRTEIIQKQNKRLIQFAFMNSHKIRGPLATLIGLLNLLNNIKSEEENKEIISHLKETATKMDEIIHEVSRELEKEDQL